MHRRRQIFDERSELRSDGGSLSVVPYMGAESDEPLRRLEVNRAGGDGGQPDRRPFALWCSGLVRRCEDGAAALGEREARGPYGGRIGIASGEVFNRSDPRWVGPPDLIKLFMEYQARLDVCEHAWIVVVNGE